MWDIDCLQGDPEIIFGGAYVKTLHMRKPFEAQAGWFFTLVRVVVTVYMLMTWTSNLTYGAECHWQEPVKQSWHIPVPCFSVLDSLLFTEEPCSSISVHNIHSFMITKLYVWWKSTPSYLILHWIPHHTSVIGFNPQVFISMGQINIYFFRIFLVEVYTYVIQFTYVSLVLPGSVGVPSRMLEQLISIQAIKLPPLRSTGLAMQVQGQGKSQLSKS